MCTLESGLGSEHYYNNVGLVYNYRNSLSEDFTGDAKNVHDENCVISAEIICTSAEKPVSVIYQANFGVKYII